MNIFKKVIQTLENRPAKIRRRNELIAERNAAEKPLRQAIGAAEAERQRLRNILDGVEVTAAQKAFERGTATINEELRGLTRELQEHPPAAIADFVEECRDLEVKHKSLLDAKLDVQRQDIMGAPLVATQFDRGSVLAAIEAIRQKERLAGELILQDIPASELSQKIQKLREGRLPEITKKKFERESVWKPVKETAIA